MQRIASSQILKLESTLVQAVLQDKLERTLLTLIFVLSAHSLTHMDVTMEEDIRGMRREIQEHP
eukprot:1998888-Prorocentrum_lima.AAC.1